MNNTIQLLNKQIKVKITGEKYFEGILADLGNDILVLYDGQRFHYIPLLHVHKIKPSNEASEVISLPSNISLTEQVNPISYRMILTNAKGLYTEIKVAGNQSLYGYITSVMSDYFVFYSPVYKTIYISFYHLKWLTLYNQDFTPYGLKSPINTLNTPLSLAFKEQLKKFENSLVVFDMGEDPEKIGVLIKIEDSMIVLLTGNGETFYLKLTHIKSAYIP